VLAGGNGAGKSTFYKNFIAPSGIAFVNADTIQKELFNPDDENASYIAAELASNLREQYLVEQRSFCFETVFSHSSKVDFVARAKALGFEITLVFIRLNDSSLNVLRASTRVSEGGNT
jgi:predicted ABC-type ATPase